MVAVTMLLADAASITGPLINLGAVGVCLVALAVYYIRKDLRYEARIDEMREMEKAFRKEQSEQQTTFRKEQADLLEKYRTAMEKFGQTLDVVVDMLRNRKDRM
jgi:hypothetical protein